MNNVFRKYKSKEAITYMMDAGTKKHYTFEKIARMVKHWAVSFKNYHIEIGDRVAIISPLMPNAVIAGLSLAYANLTTVMIDATLPVEEIQRLLVFSDVRGVFTIEKIYNQLSKNEIKNVPVFDLNACDEDLNLFHSSARFVQCEETIDKHLDVIVILFSSGTTNQMKGIMLTYESVLGSRDKFVDFAGIQPHMSYLIVFPFNHISGYVSAMIYMLTGCSLGMIENVNSAKLKKGLLEYNPYCFGMVPKVYDIMADKIMKSVHEKGAIVENCVHLMLKLSEFFRKKFGLKIGKLFFKPILKQVFGKNIYGLAILGTICKPETARLFLNLGLEWANMYATTETNTPIASTGIYDRYPINSVGKVNRYKDIKILINKPDKNGIGEIYVKTPLIMKGYFKDPELTKSAFDNGYFKTGDIGYVDKNDNLFVCGRIKESIVLHNGKKVSVADIDDFYQKLCPGVTLASCGVANDDGFDEVYLFVEQQGLSETVLQKTIEKLTEISSHTNTLYKVRKIYPIDKIPVTSVRKVKRYILKEYVQSDSVSQTDTSIHLTKSTMESIIQALNSVQHIQDITIDRSTSLKSLELDSLSMFEFCMEIENITGVNITSTPKS